jgi:hypothetical protein
MNIQIFNCEFEGQTGIPASQLPWWLIRETKGVTALAHTLTYLHIMALGH